MIEQPPRMLITGASGFTGQHAITHFSKAGFDVIGVTRKSSVTNETVHTEHCDLTIQVEVKNLINRINPQYLIHLAGQNHVGISWNDPVGSLEANAMSTAYLIEALRQNNPSCKILIVGSALQFNPASISSLPHPYSLSKTLQVLIAQSWAVLYNMHIVMAEPSNLIGPGFSNGVCSIFAKKIADIKRKKTANVLEVNNPKAQRDFLDVRDAVRAYEILLLKGEPGETYRIASGKKRSIEELINTFKSLTNVDFELNLQLNEPVENQAASIPTKLMKLGWKPEIPFEKSLNDTFNFYLQNKK